MVRQQRLGEILRMAREAQGLSLYALEAQSGVDRALLWRIERGDVSDPRPENLGRITEALGISLTDLYARTGYLAAGNLPSLPVYLRTKYGHLTTQQQRQVLDFFKQIEAEYGSPSEPRGGSKPKRRRGGQHGDDDQ